LVEIDLLRGGMHTTAVALDWLVAKAGPFDYHVSVHRFDQPLDYFVYPSRLSEPLPEIFIPLLPGDGSVALDLQALFEQCYDRGPYQRKVRYLRESVVPPLSAEQWSWASQVLLRAIN
jgi:hypothetical protein